MAGDAFCDNVVDHALIDSRFIGSAMTEAQEAGFKDQKPILACDKLPTDIETWLRVDEHRHGV